MDVADCILEIRRDLLTRFDAFSNATGLTQSQVGVEIGNDWKLLQRLQDGCNIQTKTLERMDKFLRDRGLAEAPKVEAKRRRRGMVPTPGRLP